MNWFTGDRRAERQLSIRLARSSKSPGKLGRPKPWRWTRALLRPTADFDALFAYRRHGHGNLHAGGYVDEDAATTPFDLERAAAYRDMLRKPYVAAYGEDPPEAPQWKW